MADWPQDIQDACAAIGGVATYLNHKSIAFSKVGNEIMAVELAIKAKLLVDVKSSIEDALRRQLDEKLRETKQLHDTVVMPIIKGEIKMAKGEG